jgi:hypothetical protein
MSKKNCCPDDVVTWSSILDFLFNGGCVLLVLCFVYVTYIVGWDAGRESGRESGRDSGYSGGLIDGCNKLEWHLTSKDSNVILPDCDWLVNRKD